MKIMLPTEQCLSFFHENQNKPELTFDLVHHSFMNDGLDRPKGVTVLTEPEHQK